MQIQLKNYTFQINPGQNKHYWEYINAVDWEPYTFTIFNQFITKESTVLDIGAWSGVLTLYAAKIAKSVYALDPDPICFSELKENVRLNPEISSKVTTYQTAISNKKETLELSARETYGASSSSILKRSRDTETSLKIETIPLLDFLEKESIQQVDFIKMDVEGAEFKILPTIGKALQKVNYPTLYVSFHYQFLNENIYYESNISTFLTKVLMRLERAFDFTLFKNRLRKEISGLFNDLGNYQYIYTTNGTAISLQELKKNPELIKDTDLVFTNQKWDAK